MLFLTPAARKQPAKPLQRQDDWLAAPLPFENIFLLPRAKIPARVYK